jgi:hypothetical protein
VPTRYCKGLQFKTVAPFCFLLPFCYHSLQKLHFLTGRLLPDCGFHKVGLDVQGDGGAGMAKLVLNIVNIFPLGD